MQPLTNRNKQKSPLANRPRDVSEGPPADNRAQDVTEEPDVEPVSDAVGFPFAAT